MGYQGDQRKQKHWCFFNDVFSIVFGNCHVWGVCSFRGRLLNPLEKWRTGSSSGNHGHLFLESNGRFLSFRCSMHFLSFWDAVRYERILEGSYRRSCWMSYSQDIIWLIFVGPLIKSKYFMFQRKSNLARYCCEMLRFPIQFGSLHPLSPLNQGSKVWHWFESVTWAILKGRIHWGGWSITL